MPTRELIIDGAAGLLAGRLYGAPPARSRFPRLHGKPAAATKQQRLLVFFHGGGFSGGDLDTHDHFLQRLAAAHPGLLIVAADYTLAPARPFPAAADDAYAVLLWVTRQRARLGWSGAQLLVGGVEAGANLATVAGMMARDRAGPAIAGQMLLMPMLDASLSSASMRALQGGAQQALADTCSSAYRDYLPNPLDRMHPYASPMLSSRLRGLPATLILTAQNDPLRDEALQYGARLQQAGVPATVTELPPLLVAERSDGRAECAATPAVLAEIASFLAI